MQNLTIEDVAKELGRDLFEDYASGEWMAYENNPEAIQMEIEQEATRIRRQFHFEHNRTRIIEDGDYLMIFDLLGIYDRVYDGSAYYTKGQ
jgi:hypothetical protein